tara:strand:+ start:2294 stop:2713 length:420 start_codon:yes stop_codon:yes gene_type:complete
MATGNLGDRLTPYASKTNTYLTRDGGLSWIEAAKGSHIYEFGDHGGIILMARDNVATQTLSYSWDHGKLCFVVADCCCCCCCVPVNLFAYYLYVWQLRIGFQVSFQNFEFYVSLARIKSFRRPISTEKKFLIVLGFFLM